MLFSPICVVEAGGRGLDIRMSPFDTGQHYTIRRYSADWMPPRGGARFIPSCALLGGLTGYSVVDLYSESRHDD
jgi:hypothetical protein